MSNGGDDDKSSPTPITKKISNVTNKLVSPVRTALVTSPDLRRRRRLPQSSSPSSLGGKGKGGCSGAVEATHASRADAQDARARESSPPPLSAPPPPSPDSVLSKMNVFLKDKRIRGISIVDYCRAIWLEGDDDGDDVRCSHDVQQPFFVPWLESCGKFNICVGGWEEGSPSSSSFINPWDKEAYDRMRTVTFTTKRSGIGPSTADATQTHRLRLEGNDRCIVSITVNMNVPFGDSFQVQVRWVVSRLGRSGDDVDELSVSVGMLVVFNKSCFVENKIRTNTTNETIKGQISLFENQKRVCWTISNARGVALLQDDEDDDEYEDDVTTTMDAANQNGIRSTGEGEMSILQSIWSLFLILSGRRLLSYLALAFVSLFGYMYSDSVVAREDTKQIIMEIKAAKEKLGDLEKLLEENDVTPNQTESAAAVVRITNDALRKLINKLN